MVNNVFLLALANGLIVVANALVSIDVSLNKVERKNPAWGKKPLCQNIGVHITELLCNWVLIRVSQRFVQCFFHKHWCIGAWFPIIPLMPIVGRYHQAWEGVQNIESEQVEWKWWIEHGNLKKNPKIICHHLRPFTYSIWPMVVPKIIPVFPSTLRNWTQAPVSKSVAQAAE